MTEVVLSPKIPEEQEETIRSIIDERGTTVSRFIRELIDKEINRKKVDWDASCFGSKARNDNPKEKDASVDEIVYCQW